MSTTLQMIFLSLAVMAVLVSGRKIEDMKFDSLDQENEVLSGETTNRNGKAKNWLPFSSTGTDISEDWNYHEKYHNSDSDSDSSSSGSHQSHDHSNMDCDKLKQIYEQESQKLRISNHICRMNITQFENLAHECIHHLDEEKEDITDYTNLLTMCEADTKALIILIDAEKVKSSACATVNKDLETKITAQQKINADFLTMNLGLADHIGFCQDDVYDCQVDINTCLDSCGH